MRCPDCNKFVGYEEGEPEIELSLDAPTPEDVNPVAVVTGEARIVLSCGECGTELKEATLTFESQVEVPAGHIGDGHELSLADEQPSGEMTSRTEGRGRRVRTFYGATVDAEVTCSCGNFVAYETLSDDVQASAMDETV